MVSDHLDEELCPFPLAEAQRLAAFKRFHLVPFVAGIKLDSSGVFDALVVRKRRLKSVGAAHGATAVAARLEGSARRRTQLVNRVMGMLPNAATEGDTVAFIG